MPVEYLPIYGETIVEIKDLDIHSSCVLFRCKSGKSFVMFHEHDCSEEVEIEDIIGNPKDLIGEPLFIAEVVSSNTILPPKGKEHEDNLWTFYKFATIRGYVTVRWFGTSNGYYSVKVDFKEKTS